MPTEDHKMELEAPGIQRSLFWICLLWVFFFFLVDLHFEARCGGRQFHLSAELYTGGHSFQFYNRISAEIQT